MNNNLPCVTLKSIWLLLFHFLPQNKSHLYLLNETVKCIRQAIIFGVSYTKFLHLQKYFIHCKGLKISLNLTDTDPIGKTEVISCRLVSSRDFGRRAEMWATAKVSREEEGWMADSCDDREDQSRNKTVSIPSVSENIQYFLQGNGVPTEIVIK